MILIGIDPGKSGAIAIQHPTKIELIKMPESSKELLSIFQRFKDCKVYLERVVQRPQDIKTKGEADSAKIGKMMQMQKLFAQYKQLLTLMELVDITEENSNLVLVMPMVWQRGINLYVKGEDYKERKDRLSDFAKAYFSPLKVIKQTADAVLILKYACKKEYVQMKNHSPKQLKII